MKTTRGVKDGIPTRSVGTSYTSPTRQRVHASEEFTRWRVVLVWLLFVVFARPDPSPESQRVHGLPKCTRGRVVLVWAISKVLVALDPKRPGFFV